MLDVKNDFPILKRRINGKKLVYLDSAATSQKPKQVIDAEKKFYEKSNANVHRAIHALSEEATKIYEESRDTVAKFLGVDPRSVVFTKGTTEGINIVANSGLFKKGDEIIVTYLEHHSNLVPWLALKDKGVIVKFAEMNNDGTINYNHLISQVNENTKLIAISLVSNSLGTINDIALLNDKLDDLYRFKTTPRPMVLLDAAQGVGHVPIDKDRICWDLLVFSGHKMFGPTGIGVLQARLDILMKMEPLIRGGDMIKSVSTESAEWNDVPYKFEGGTQNIAGAVGLAEAVRYIQKLGIEKIRKHDRELMEYALKKLSKIDKITIYGPRDSDIRSGSISFNLFGIHPHDVAQILSHHGIMIRSGHLCTQPLMKKLNVPAVCRASFHVYNDKKDIDMLVLGLEAVKKVFK